MTNKYGCIPKDGGLVVTNTNGDAFYATKVCVCVCVCVRGVCVFLCVTRSFRCLHNLREAVFSNTELHSSHSHISFQYHAMTRHAYLFL